jgi:hypothetical protein
MRMRSLPASPGSWIERVRGLGLLVLPAASIVLLTVVDSAPPARAEILNSSPVGFTVRSEAVLGAGLESSYNALTMRIASWWDPNHTFSGDAKNLTLDARAGGCFCETLPDGGSVRHMEVVFASPGRMLRMIGALGPLQGSGLAGSMTWGFQEDGDSTRVALTYSVGGYCGSDIMEIAPAVDSVLNEQLMRLKAYVETGRPEAQ